MSSWKRIKRGGWVVAFAITATISMIFLIMDPSWRITCGLGLLLSGVGFVIELFRATARNSGYDPDDKDQFEMFLVEEFRDDRDK